MLNIKKVALSCALLIGLSAGLRKRKNAVKLQLPKWIGDQLLIRRRFLSFA